MISEYIKAAMHQAHYEILPDDNLYYGEIILLPGVYATGNSLEECREELVSVLEDWLLISINKNLDIPVMDGISLEIKHVA